MACSLCKTIDVNLMMCGGCKSVSYCSKDCQVKDWRIEHKNECKILAIWKGVRDDNARFLEQTFSNLSGNNRFTLLNKLDPIHHLTPLLLAKKIGSLEAVRSLESIEVTLKGNHDLTISFKHKLGLTLGAMIIEDVSSQAIKIVNDLRNKNSFSHYFTVNPTESADVVCAQWTSESKHSVLTLFHKFTGMTLEEGDVAASEVRSFIKDYMQKCRGTGRYYFVGMKEGNNKFLFNSDQTQSDIDNWAYKFNYDFICHLYKFLGYVELEPIMITEEQKIHFRLNPEDKIPNPLKFSCVAYALLMACEVKAKKLIFDSSIEEVDHFITDCEKNLKMYGWENVFFPKEGDLVLYRKESTNQIAHIGYYSGDGKVTSKLGINQEHVHRHGLYDVGLFYGEDLIFMRKVT